MHFSAGFSAFYRRRGAVSRHPRRRWPALRCQLRRRSDAAAPAPAQTSFWTIQVIPPVKGKNRANIIKRCFVFCICWVSYCFYCLALVKNSWLRLRDGFQNYVQIFGTSKFWPNVGPWIPFFLQKYSQTYKNIPNRLKHIIFANRKISNLENGGTRVYQTSGMFWCEARNF